MSDYLKTPLFGPTPIPGHVASCPWCGMTTGVYDFPGLRTEFGDEKSCHRCGRCFYAKPMKDGHLMVPMRGDDEVDVMTGRAIMP